MNKTDIFSGIIVFPLMGLMYLAFHPKELKSLTELPNIKEGECYSGEFGHFKKDVLIAKVLKCDNQYILYNWCNNKCDNEINRNSQEVGILAFNELYNKKVVCP